MIFCEQCQTYLEPDEPSCPACGAPRPQAGVIPPLWSAELERVPVGPPLVAGDLLLVPVQGAGSLPQPAAC